jgi:hypothetical protein
MPSLKEELLRLERKRNGAGRLASLYYTQRQRNTYFNYALRSVFSIGCRVERIKDFVKWCSAASVFWGAFTSDMKHMFPGIFFDALAGAAAGAVLEYVTSYPSMYKEFKSILTEIRALGGGEKAF